jgi:hypothetical protein
VNPEEISFRKRFCAYSGCPDEDYEAEALKRFLYPPWSRLTWLLMRVAPSLIATDLQIVRQLGLVTSGSNFAAEVRDIHGDYGRKKDFGILRKSFRLRLSRERIFNCSKRLWSRRAGGERATELDEVKLKQAVLSGARGGN